MSDFEINPAHNSGKKGDDQNSRIMCWVKVVRHYFLGMPIAVIEIKGIGDSFNRQELEETIEELLAERFYRFIFDLSGVAITGSTSLGFFIKLVAQTKEKDGGVVVLQPSQEIKTAFEVVGLGEYIHLANDLESALKSFLTPESESSLIPI
jgi:anti-anti-sigma factor